MIDCNSVLNAVMSALLSDGNMSNVTVMKEFPSEKRDSPVDGAMVTVGADGVTIERDNGNIKLSKDNSPMTISVKLLLCVPKAFGGNMCYEIFDRVMNSLCTLIPKYSILGIKSGEVRYSTMIKALVLPINVTVSIGNVY